MKRLTDEQAFMLAVRAGVPIRVNGDRIETVDPVGFAEIDGRITVITTAVKQETQCPTIPPS